MCVFVIGIEQNKQSVFHCAASSGNDVALKEALAVSDSKIIDKQDIVSAYL